MALARWLLAAASATVSVCTASSSTVSIGPDQKWLINSLPVSAGSQSEGLLLNARLIQAVFDDSNASTRHIWAYPDTGKWDPDRNTDELIGNLTAWRAAGMTAFTVSMLCSQCSRWALTGPLLSCAAVLPPLVSQRRSPVRPPNSRSRGP